MANYNDDIKKAMQTGNTENLINSLSKEDKQKLNNILNDKDALEKVMNSPQAKALMKLFNKK